LPPSALLLHHNNPSQTQNTPSQSHNEMSPTCNSFIHSPKSPNINSDRIVLHGDRETDDTHSVSQAFVPADSYTLLLKRKEPEYKAVVPGHWRTQIHATPTTND